MDIQRMNVAAEPTVFAPPLRVRLQALGYILLRRPMSSRGSSGTWWQFCGKYLRVE